MIHRLRRKSHLLMRLPLKKSSFRFSSATSSSSNNHDIYAKKKHQNEPDEDSSQIRHILLDNAKRLWPKDDPALRARVALALSLLVGAKVVNVQVPFIFKSLVDSLSIPPEQLMTAGAPLALVAGYGVARSSASLFQELRSAVFAKVVQTAIRDVARESFLKLHNLDLSFHLQRQTVRDLSFSLSLSLSLSHTHTHSYRENYSELLIEDREALIMSCDPCCST